MLFALLCLLYIGQAQSAAQKRSANGRIAQNGKEHSMTQQGSEASRGKYQLGDAWSQDDAVRADRSEFWSMKMQHGKGVPRTMWVASAYGSTDKSSLQNERSETLSALTQLEQMERVILGAARQKIKTARSFVQTGGTDENKFPWNILPSPLNEAKVFFIFAVILLLLCAKVCFLGQYILRY